MLSVIVLNVIMLIVDVLNVVMLSVVMLNGVMLSVVVVCVVAPNRIKGIKNFNKKVQKFSLLQASNISLSPYLTSFFSFSISSR
jgi:hypothetical protein